MEETSIKKKTVQGVVWSFAETSSLTVIQFIIGIIMARLLMPHDYGVIAIINVFLSISQIFIDGGFTTTLIQEKRKTERDFSTIFSFNVIVSLFCYSVLFAAAPYISDFYAIDLTKYLRVLALTLIISSISAIHKTKLTIEVDFKKLAKISVISVLVSGSIGIALAYRGLGVWSLIIQSILNSLISTFLIISKTHWKPVCLFDVGSFRHLFPFGFRLFCASIIDRIYSNLYPIFVGKFFTSSNLGFFSRADQFSSLPAGICNNVFLRVSFPVLSSIKDEETLVSSYRKYVSFTSFIVFPLMLLLVACAKSLVLLLLTEKWSNAIIFIQILSFGYLFDSLSSINRNVLYVKGRADLALKLEIIKKIIAILILLFSVFTGLIGLCIGKAFYGCLALLLNSLYTKDLINVSLWSQIKDFYPSLVIGLISLVFTMFFNSFFVNAFFQLIVSVLVFLFCYISLSYIFRVTPLFVFKTEILKYIKR